MLSMIQRAHISWECVNYCTVQGLKIWFLWHRVRIPGIALICYLKPWSEWSATSKNQQCKASSSKWVNWRTASWTHRCTSTGSLWCVEWKVRPFFSTATFTRAWAKIRYMQIRKGLNTEILGSNIFWPTATSSSRCCAANSPTLPCLDMPFMCKWRCETAVPNRSSAQNDLGHPLGHQRK